MQRSMIMAKTEQLKEAIKKVTYWDVIRAFNNVNKLLDGEYYSSTVNLTTPEGQKVPGFVYTGYAAGVGIRKVLDALGIKYSTFMKGGSGINEESEIHITDEKSQKRFLDILEKCGDFRANVSMEMNTMNEKRNNPLLQNIR